MAVYTIIRIYKVPADSHYQATERMLEALALNVAEGFHVTDIVKAPDDKKGQGKPVDLRPPAGWLKLFRQQLTGKW